MPAPNDQSRELRHFAEFVAILRGRPTRKALAEFDPDDAESHIAARLLRGDDRGRRFFGAARTDRALSFAREVGLLGPGLSPAV